MSKGSSMNGIIIKQDTKLCVASNVDEFTHEVENIGIILEQSIIPGPTYIPEVSSK